MFFFKKQTENKDAGWLIVGLGNPGPRYEATRHNVGFMCADFIAARLGTRINRLKFRALYGEATHPSGRIIILKPQTFMNLSGESVREAAHFYGLPAERIIVVSDDVTIAPGRIRVRRAGSDGGHNGLKNIIYHLKTDAFPRVKIGVGSPSHPDYDMVDWVLSRLAEADLKVMAPAIEAAGLAALDIIENGVNSAMNKFNGPVPRT